MLGTHVECIPVIHTWGHRFFCLVAGGEWETPETTIAQKRGPTRKSAPDLRRKRVTLTYAVAGSAFSGFTPSSAIAFVAFFASNLPSRASLDNAAAAIDAAFTSK